MNITIKMKDGAVHDFRHTGRAGGSYSKSIRYEGEFAIVTDEWGKETAFPAQDIKQINTEPNYRTW